MGNWIEPIYAVCFVLGIIYILSMLYHIYWLRSQLQHGFSPEHTEGNYSSRKKVQSAGSMALIFSGTVLARYMTAGQADIFLDVCRSIVCYGILTLEPRVYLCHDIKVAEQRILGRISSRGWDRRDF